MRNLSVLLAGALAGACFLSLINESPALAQAATASIAAAVANPARPAADTARDAERKPAEVLAFSGVKPGDKVLEVLPGGGYFSRLFSGAVGPAGRVYAAAPGVNPETGKSAAAKPADPAFENVTPITLGRQIAVPEPVDLIFTAQNYHDFHLSRRNLDVAALDRGLFAALKPGGLLIIEDHAAVPGSDLTVPDQLHRINEDIVKQEVEAAGFVLDGESEALRNPADPRTEIVFAPDIRGHTDQFLLRFRKPL